MPQVPSYGGQQVAPTGSPGGAFAAPAIRDFSGQQTQQFGEALQRVGQTMSSIETDMAQQANQIRVDDALNKMRQQSLDLTYNEKTGYRSLKGDAALTRPDGRPLDEEYGEKLQGTASDLSQSLGNDAQRQVFARESANLLTQFRGNVQQYSTQEYQQHAMSVQDGTIKIGMDEAKLNWQDPAKISQSLESVKAAVYRSSTLQGWSANETTARIKATTSTVHTGIIDTALQNNNPDYALAYVDRFKEEMTADDLLKVRGVINKDLQARTAETIATAVMGAYRTQASPTDSSRVRAITMATESGGNPDAVGPYIAGQGSAKGSMQVMDATNRSPGFGITPARDDSKEERVRVGNEYIDKMVQRYAGDTGKAWAAYNAGPGALDDAVKKAGPGGDWLALMPKETQNYVAKNTAALQGGGGAPAKPTLQQVHDGVREQVSKRYGPTPPAGVLKMALASATQQFEDNAKAIKSAEDQQVTDAMRALEQNGGRVSALPYAVRSQIPPDKLDNVLAFGQKVAKGDDITNDAVYLRLSNPDVLRRLSDNEFYHLRGELSQSDFQRFSNQRAAEAGKATNKVEEINTSATDRVLRDRLRTLQIDPTPKDGSPEAARVGAIRKYVDDSMLAQQKVGNKQMSDAEVEKHIDGLFSKSATFRDSFLGIQYGSTTDRMLTMKPSNVPGDIKDRLRADFKAAGIANPSDADLLGAYWRLQGIAKKPSAPAQTNQFKSGTIKPRKVE